jgi:N-acetylmuramoyl-L-alanine amidase
MTDSFSPDCSLVRTVRPSPCHDDRPADGGIDILLLHYTGMQTAEDALARLSEEASRVSCHYLVDEDGTIIQMVPESRRAWHAGLSVWADDTDINARSIGIEIVNPGHEFGYRPFPDAQIAAVISLGRDICGRHGIPAERVLAHSDVAPRRKQDPGELFPWGRLAEAGIGHWVAPVELSDEPFTFFAGDEGEPVEELQSLLSLYGYGIEISGRYDPGTTAVVTAFQRHFRPARIDGLADRSTMETLKGLLAALP